MMNGLGRERAEGGGGVVKCDFQGNNNNLITLDKPPIHLFILSLYTF
jgi:hypothetical protein